LSQKWTDKPLKGLCELHLKLVKHVAISRGHQRRSALLGDDFYPATSFSFPIRYRLRLRPLYETK
jgi:hypothetical protein